MTTPQLSAVDVGPGVNAGAMAAPGRPPGGRDQVSATVVPSVNASSKIE